MNALWWLSVALLVASLAAVVAWYRPELLLAAVALWLPSGTVYPPLRVGISSSFVTLLGVSLLLVVCVNLFKPHALREGLQHPLFKIGVAVLIGGAVSAIGSSDPVGSAFVGGTFALTLMALSIALAHRIRLNLGSVQRVFLMVGLPVAIIAIYQSAFDNKFLASFYAGKVSGYIAGGAGFRPVSTLGNALVASSVFACLFGLSFVAPILGRTRVVYLLVFGVAVAMSLSRSSILILALVTILYILFGSGARTAISQQRRIFVAVAGTVILLAFGGAVASRVSVRLTGRSFFQDNVRSANGSSALGLWRENWLTGLGYGGYRRVAEARGLHIAATVDNQYVSLLVETGLVGVVLILIVLLRTRIVRDGAQGEMLIPLLAALGIGLFFESLYNDATVLLTGAFFMMVAIPVRNYSFGPKQPRQSSLKILPLESSASGQR